jgi:hypothetical protein
MNDTEKAIIEHAGKIQSKELAKMLGITRGALSWHAAKLGVSLAMPGYRSERMRATWQRRRKTFTIPDANKLWRPTSCE